MSVLQETVGVANRFLKVIDKCCECDIAGKMDCLHEGANFLLCRKEISLKELKVSFD